MHSRAVPRDRVNELDMPRIPFSTFAVVLTRPASGTVISTWAETGVAPNAINAAARKMRTAPKLKFEYCIGPLSWVKGYRGSWALNGGPPAAQKAPVKSAILHGAAEAGGLTF
jgi:hypothetical protein